MYKKILPHVSGLAMVPCYSPRHQVGISNRNERFEKTEQRDLFRRILNCLHLRLRRGVFSVFCSFSAVLSSLSSQWKNDKRRFLAALLELFTYTNHRARWWDMWQPCSKDAVYGPRFFTCCDSSEAVTHPEMPHSIKTGVLNCFGCSGPGEL